jgi:hypothetical protein
LGLESAEHVGQLDLSENGGSKRDERKTWRGSPFTFSAVFCFFTRRKTKYLEKIQGVVNERKSETDIGVGVG